MAYLREHLTFDRAGLIVESVKEGDEKTKALYMKGIFILFFSIFFILISQIMSNFDS